MVLAGVIAHYRKAGWTVLERPTVGQEAPFFRPDLVLQRKGQTRAVLVREEPPGPLELGTFAAHCKRHDIPGLVICPVEEAVQAACDLHGLDALDVDQFYVAAQAPAIMASPPLAAPTAPAPPPRPPGPAVATTLGTRATIPWWRWAIVGAIWAAALLAVGRWYALYQ